MPKHKRYKSWLEQAKFDIEAAKLSFDNKFYEWACYQSVQAVEKALKAVIVHGSWSPPKTHKLGILLSIANRANNYFSKVRLNFRPLEAYTFISRYPFLIPAQSHLSPHEIITQEDATTCLTIADEIYAKVNAFLTENAPYDGEVFNPENYYYSEMEIKERIDSAVKAIVDGQDVKAQKIILFGRMAREKTPTKETTMDLIIIGETNLNFVDRIKYIREITRGAEPIIEPLVYTPEEFKFLHEEEGEGFIESAIGEGRVVYENSVSGS